MKKEQTKIEAGRYVAPQISEHALAVRKCIAQSPDPYNPGATVDDFNHTIE